MEKIRTIEYRDCVSSTFTEYVRGATGDTPQGWSRFDGILKALRNLLVQELKRRELWSAPPRYLGIFGGNRWEEGDLLDELVLDCFEYIFVRRIQGLRNQARVHSNIDGLIILNVQHFLHDAQRRHDPLGYRVFEIARDAVEALQKGGSLHLWAGDPNIRNDTLLGFSSHVDESTAQCPDPSLIRGWNDSLMPELVTAWHREGVVGELAARIAGLNQEGCPAFRFRDLVHPLKEDARGRWLAMVYENVEPEHGPEAANSQLLLMPVLEPRLALEEEQNYQRLLICIARGIEQASADERTKSYLRRLLSFLRQWTAALEEGPGTGPPPADSRIGELLQIPRGRIQGLKEALGNLANTCRGRRAIAEEGPPVWSTLRPARLPAQVANTLEARLMNLSKRREQLGRLFSEALAETKGQPADGPPPVAGDTLVFPGAEPGVEWLLVARDEDERALLVPLDSMPLAGGRDLSLEEQMGEPLTARCGCPVRLSDDLLPAGSKARHVEEEIVRQVRAKLDEVALDTGTPNLFEQEAEVDSEYRAWMERLRASRLQIQAQLRTSGREAPDIAPTSVSSRRRPRRAFSPAYALAAVLAVALVGLSIYVQSLRQRVQQATDPILLPSGSAGEIRFGTEERGLETRLVAAGKDHALLYLVFRDVPEYPRYAVRLLHADGAVWWQSQTFSRGEQLLVLPVRAEPVRLQLLGVGADGTESILDDRRLLPEAQDAAP